VAEAGTSRGAAVAGRVRHVAVPPSLVAGAVLAQARELVIRVRCNAFRKFPIASRSDALEFGFH